MWKHHLAFRLRVCLGRRKMACCVLLGGRSVLEERDLKEDGMSKISCLEIRKDGIFLNENKLESVISYTLSQNAEERTAELQITMDVETVKFADEIGLPKK